MAGDLSMPDSFANKEEMYAYVLAHLEQHLIALQETHSKFDSQLNLYTGLANASSLLYYALNSLQPSSSGGSKVPQPQEQLLHKATVNWVGFYLIANAQYMVLGPFQGKVACTKIKIGKGVCGTAVLLGKTQCVPNVHEFPGHIACDGGSMSEIVVPIRDKEGRIVGVLDCDSTVLSRFDSVDVCKLTEVCVLISKYVSFPAVADVRTRGMEPLDGRDPTTTEPPSSAPSSGIATAKIDAVSSPVSSSQNAPALRLASRSPPKNPASQIIRNPVVPAISADGGPNSPTTKRKELAEWSISCQRLDRIISAQEIGRWESVHHLGCIPEIVFPLNSLKLSFLNKMTNVRTTLTIDAESYFVSAAEFYQASKQEISDKNVAKKESSSSPISEGASTDKEESLIVPTKDNVRSGHTPDETYQGMLEEQSYLKIPVADSWKQSKFGTFDPNIDWASRSNYICGISVESQGDASSIQAPSFVRSPTEVINYDLLKRRDMDILLYDAFDLFEDDLHDCGISKASVKVRVMPLCIFVLVRHVVRIDAAGAMARDVRLFVELNPPGTTSPKKTKVIAEVTYKRTIFPPAQVGLTPGTPQQQTRQVESADKSHLRVGIDELVEGMTQVAPAKNYVLEL